MAPRTNPLPQIDSVLMAVRYAERMFPEQLSILPSAWESASDSEYRDPFHVLRAMTVLGLFGHAGDLRTALRDTMGKKAKWRPRDSKATRNAHTGSRRWRGSDGLLHDFESHITIGRGAPRCACVQIYYRVNEQGTVEVGWTGDHRPTVSTGR